ncbi:hypothetical protein ACFQZX_15730 [Mucilaginibacter litoreus]|uniref:Haem-binding domain-containing protein n=1 Tax=Mucilaginibacter litoreus TaxID=1048221 RepID=A0ABW3AW18_9SPHI
MMYAWALLLCFVTGQYMVYAHQHNIIKTAHKTSYADTHNSSKQAFKEKCEICDSMHHTHMELVKPNYAISFVSVKRVYVSQRYNFKSIGQILASGRAPPVVS